MCFFNQTQIELTGKTRKISVETKAISKYGKQKTQNAYKFS